MARSELYHLIWREPLSKVAPILGVSKPTLLKTCRTHQIPVPGRGHWTRVKAGQSLQPEDLPEGPDVEVEMLPVKSVTPTQQSLVGAREAPGPDLSDGSLLPANAGIEWLLNLGLHKSRASATNEYLIHLLLSTDNLGGELSAQVRQWAQAKLISEAER